MCTYNLMSASKVGPKFKITKKTNLRIKRAISYFQSQCEKINSRKILEISESNVSVRTVQRHLLRMQLKYKRVSSIIIISLTKAHKEKRVAAVSAWIADQHCLEKTIFRDEKRIFIGWP